MAYSKKPGQNRRTIATPRSAQVKPGSKGRTRGRKRSNPAPSQARVVNAGRKRTRGGKRGE